MMCNVQLKSAFTAPDPIYGMDISGTLLATAGPNACVQLLELDYDGIGQKGKGLSHILECTLEEDVPSLLVPLW